MVCRETSGRVEGERNGSARQPDRLSTRQREIVLTAEDLRSVKDTKRQDMHAHSQKPASISLPHILKDTIFYALDHQTRKFCALEESLFGVEKVEVEEQEECKERIALKNTHYAIYYCIK